MLARKRRERERVPLEQPNVSGQTISLMTSYLVWSCNRMVLEEMEKIRFRGPDGRQISLIHKSELMEGSQKVWVRYDVFVEDKLRGNVVIALEDSARIAIEVKGPDVKAFQNGIKRFLKEYFRNEANQKAGFILPKVC